MITANVSWVTCRPVTLRPTLVSDHRVQTMSSVVPCQVGDPDLWFSDIAADLEQAKQLCLDCPIRVGCLRAALERREPWGVWGGEILDRGVVIAQKRPRGRPPKSAA